MAPRLLSPGQKARNRIQAARRSADGQLDLSELGLRRLPDEIWELGHLTRLLLNNNALESIPEEISCLRRLQRLDLQSNILSSLPPLDALEGLYILDLSENRFERLPATIFDLPSLQLLFANTNQLVELPSAIGRLTQLEVLMANGNRIRELPREMAQLTKLLNLDLERNPLRDPLSSLLTAGTSDLFSYLRSLDDARPQYEGKLLLVGEGEVGKSSLVAAVNATAFLEGRDSTHGIELTPLHFRHPALPLDMLLNAWDFGGQEIYRITHQFFFTRRAIYLVVWKPRQGQDDNAIEDWCRRISLRVGNEAKILIVATHASHRVAELDYPQLKAKFGDVLVGNHVVDNENGTGISELRSAIARHAAELPQMGEIVSAAWQAARTELLQLSEAQIPYERFGEICAGHGLDGNATRALARMLHNLGRIIHYDEDDGLRDVVVLQPEWLTKAISYVLEDAPTRSANGLLDHHRLPEIWDADELGGYSARDHPFFLRLMEKFDVSYRIPDTQQSLVGQLVPYERPEIPWSKSARTRTLSLRCLLSEPVDGLIGWLTVRHHRFSVGTHWRRGVFVEHREWGSQALLELVGARQLDLTVSGPSPDAFASILRDGIEYLIAQRWEGLSYELLVPCRGALEDGSPCPESFKFRHLIRDREDGDSETRCPECRTRFDVSELLTGFAPERGSLQGELQAIQERIAEVGADVADIKAVTSASANQVRLVLRAVSEEVIDCPRLFTLVPLARKGSGALRFWETTSQLTLWCEHADHEHPWREASYEIDQTKEWAAQIAPYAALVVKTLQVVVPISVAGLGVGMSEADLKTIKSELDLMKTVVDKLPVPAGSGVTAEGNSGQLTKAEGAGLRVLRALLAKKDNASAFGRLRRRQTPAGDFVWICPEHIQAYDPGLPILPTPPDR